MTDEEKHLEIMLEMEGIRKDIEFIKEAVPQIWKNKEDIIKITFFQSIGKYVGTLVSGLVMFIAIRSAWGWFKH